MSLSFGMLGALEDRVVDQMLDNSTCVMTSTMRFIRTSLVLLSIMTKGI